MSALTERLRGWALHLATRGWHVFPIRPGVKSPPALHSEDTCPRAGICAQGHLKWETRATTDPDHIHHWWRHTPYGIGIATGPSGLIVVDLDTLKPGETPPARWAALGIDSGAGALRSLARQRGVAVTPTWAVRTPSGGWHLYYTTPPATALRNTTGEIGSKIDTRAHGGYVVAPGCPVPPGGYALVDDRDPAPLPTWLHHALAPRLSTGLSTPTVAATTNPTAYTLAALRGECHRVRTAPPGTHNATLCRAAYALGQLLGASLLDQTTATAELTAAAHHMITTDCGCTPREITRVITTSLTAGAANPRRTHHRRAA